jgi:menaquinone-dependent protoporphyrinogen oxidase
MMKTESENASSEILVAYASATGTTAEVAAEVAKVLRAAGLTVDVMRVQDVKDIKAYSAVIFGTALRMGKPIGPGVRFATRFSAALAQVPVALFSVGIGMREDTPVARDKTRTMLAPILQAIPTPVSLEFFGGRLDYSKLNPFYRWMFKRVKSDDLAEGDWRNWEAIRAWAGTLAPLLIKAA